MKTTSTQHHRSPYILSALSIAAAMILGACAQVPRQGSLQVSVSDHRDAISDFSEFMIEIDGIDLHLANQPVDIGWITLEPQVTEVDLTQLVGAKHQQVLEQDLPADFYDALRVNLSGVRGLLLNGEQLAFDDFSETGRLEFRLEAGETVRVLVDLKVQSQHDHPGSGYLLLLSEVRAFGQNSTE